MLKIAHAITIEEEETNEYYDSDKSRNGGGYHQPIITATLMSGIKITIFDTFCGEFGARVDITMSMDNTTFAYCSIDSVGGYDCNSTFDKDIELHRIAESVIDYLGYGWAFYYKQEVDEYYDWYERGDVCLLLFFFANETLTIVKGGALLC